MYPGRTTQPPSWARYVAPPRYLLQERYGRHPAVPCRTPLALATSASTLLDAYVRSSALGEEPSRKVRN